MESKLAAFWNGLPHQAQAVFVALGGGIIGVLEPVIEHWASGQVVCTVATGLCIKGYAVSALKAGILAVMGLYVKSSLYQPKSNS